MLGAAFFAAGCHNNNDASGYGIAWVTLTDSPGDFTTYTVNVDSVTLTRNDGYVATALASVETVDFTKLNNIAELWGTATIPTGTYTQATIVLDYTDAVIGVQVNGVPQKASVVDINGAAVTTQTINVILDPQNPLTLIPTYATTSAQRLAIDFNLAASTRSINLGGAEPTVIIQPYVTAAIAPPDNKLLRVRGPLINSSVDLLTYTVYVRPFYDEINSLGSLTMFTDATTNYTINGVVSTGATGLTQLSQSSAGTTVTAAYTTYQPVATPSATAANFNARYVIAGSTLEDVYTQGIEGDVIARTGNTLTVRGATLQFNDGTSSYGVPQGTLPPVGVVPDSTVILGPATLVTADDQPTLTGLNYTDVAVGQHIIARGIYELPNNKVTIDATGASSTNTGSVRLITTDLWGSLVSSAAGNLLLNVQSISNWPVTDFNFAGNGKSAATDPTGASFLVNTGAIPIPDTTAGVPLWVDGIVAPFGSAPPAFNATSVNDELSVQQIGAVAPSTTCGQVEPDCMPASLRIAWSSTNHPFLTLTGDGATLNLADPGFIDASIRIGAESIALTAGSASPQIMPTAPPSSTTATANAAGSVPQNLPPIFLPEYSFGNPAAVAPLGISQFSRFDLFANGIATALATTPARQFEARGTYSRATNTFYAISVNVVL